MTPPPSTATRPRVEGDREQQLLDATLAVLAEVGYDRLTMDAVATAAKASKATLYRRWTNKAELVVDALGSLKDPPADAIDTGTLRGDLIATFCGTGGMVEPETLASFTSVMTAITTDPEFAAVFRERVLGPKLAVAHQIYVRAKARGEIRADLDLDLLEPALPGIVLHRACVLGDLPTPDLIARVIDEIILPAATRPPAGPTT